MKVRMKILVIFSLVFMGCGLWGAFFPQGWADGIDSPSASLQATAAKTKANSIQIEGVNFYYRRDSETLYYKLKGTWQDEHPAMEPQGRVLETLAQRAYQSANVEAPLSQWQWHGGPSPRVFQPKVHIMNPSSDKALVDVKLRVTIQAKWGQLRVDPRVYVTDYDHLEKTARWVTVAEDELAVAALAPGEEQLLPTKPIHLMAMLRTATHQWPAEIRVKALQVGHSSYGEGVLKLVPDHFVMPYWYY